MAALGVTYLVTQLLRFGGQQTRLTVAAVALTFLFFGASAKPLSFKALRPGTETYGLPMALSRAPQRRDAPVHSAGLLLRLLLERPSRLDGVLARSHNPPGPWSPTCWSSTPRPSPARSRGSRRCPSTRIVWGCIALPRWSRVTPRPWRQPLGRLSSCGIRPAYSGIRGVLPAIRNGSPPLPV